MSIGLDASFVDASCPKDLKPYREADKLRFEKADYMAWLNGAYIQSAVLSAVDMCLHGKKSKAEYYKDSFSRISKKENRKLTKAEIDFQRNSFLKSLEAMAENFEKSKKQSGDG